MFFSPIEKLTNKQNFYQLTCLQANPNEGQNNCSDKTSIKRKTQESCIADYQNGKICI